MATLFKSLAVLLEKVEATKKRLEIIAIAADFLKSLDAEEVEPAVSLILGRAFPKWSQKTLDVSWATLSGILQRITDAGWNVFHEAFARTGDVGAAAEAIFETANVKRQTLLLNEALTILEVRRLMDAIASAA
ncbi:MAG: hypothetical protein QXL10_00385, partial [Candidatus Bathyarchaeia archaeon]